ncbi:MAG: cytochrome c [Leptothrix ochracea]|uniref:c-type cytochrome n=1 Tax=Leptothrix ochracea TaxID=735331 RepID=UPI0034E198CA
MISRSIPAMLWMAIWLTACAPSAPTGADANDKVQVQLGKTIYAQRCASCHGAALEGQPEWQSRKADGKLPAPPHDGSGHTWHHDDKTLFEITQNGLEKYAGPNYATDMPRFAGVLSPAETWAVLAYIKSTWPTDVAQHQRSLNR